MWTRRACSSIQITRLGKQRGQLPTCQLKPKTVYLGQIASLFLGIRNLASDFVFFSRVEKYRPATLSDVSGHKDVLATLNKFVEANVSDGRFLQRNRICVLILILATRDCHIFFSMGHPEPARHRPSLHSQSKSMVARTCDRWCLNSMLVTIGESMLSGNKSRRLPAQSRSFRYRGSQKGIVWDPSN